MDEGGLPGEDFAFDFEAHLAEDEKTRQAEFQQRQQQLQQQQLQQPQPANGGAQLAGHHRMASGQNGGGAAGDQRGGDRGLVSSGGSQLGGRKHPASGPPHGAPGVKRAKATHYVVCRHWLRGMCIKGDHCDFLHIFDPNRMPVCRQYRKMGRCLEYEQDTCPLRHELEEPDTAVGVSGGAGADDGGSGIAETQLGGDSGSTAGSHGGGPARRRQGGWRRGLHSYMGVSGTDERRRQPQQQPAAQQPYSQQIGIPGEGGVAGTGMDARQLAQVGGGRRSRSVTESVSVGQTQPGQYQQGPGVMAQQQQRSPLVCLQYLFGFCTYGPQCAQRHVTIRPGQRPRIPVPDWYLRLVVLSPFADSLPMMDPVAAFDVSRQWQDFAESFITPEDKLTGKVSKRSLLEMLPPVPPDCPLPAPPRISELKVRCFVIKSVKIENILTSVQRGIWATGRANMVKLLDAYMTCHHVVLLMSANESGGFQGYARMSTPPDPGLYPGVWGTFSAKLSPNFRVRWLKQCKLDFEALGSHTNPWNEHKPLRKSRDGQEMPYELATAICQRLDAAASEDLLLGTPLQFQARIDHDTFFDLSVADRNKKEVELGLRNPVEKPLLQHIQQMRQYQSMLLSAAGGSQLAPGGGGRGSGAVLYGRQALPYGQWSPSHQTMGMGSATY